MIGNTDIALYFLYIQHNGEGYEYHYVIRVDPETGRFLTLKNPEGFTGHNPELLDEAFTDLFDVKPSLLTEIHTEFLATKTLEAPTEEEIDAYLDLGTYPPEPRTHFLLSKNTHHQMKDALGSYANTFPAKWLAIANEATGGGGGAAADPQAVIPARRRISSCEESKANSPEPQRDEDSSSSEYVSIGTTPALSRVSSDLSQRTAASDSRAVLGGGPARALSDDREADADTIASITAAMARLEQEEAAKATAQATPAAH